MSQEIQDCFNRLVEGVKSKPSLKTKTLYLKTWKGVDDILDNVSGVQILNETGNYITGVTLVELECHGNYLTLAKEVSQKIQDYLQDQGHIVKSTSTY